MKDKSLVITFVTATLVGNSFVGLFIPKLSVLYTMQSQFNPMIDKILFLNNFDFLLNFGTAQIISTWVTTLITHISFFFLLFLVPYQTTRLLARKF